MSPSHSGDGSIGKLSDRATWRSDDWSANQPFDLVNGLRPLGEREDSKSFVSGARASLMGTVVFVGKAGVDQFAISLFFWTVSLFAFGVPKTGLRWCSSEKWGFKQNGGQKGFLGQSKSAFCLKRELYVFSLLQV